MLMKKECILTDSYSENDIFSGVIKANLSGHFSVFPILKSKKNPFKDILQTIAYLG